MISRRFVYFLFAGGTAACVNFGSRFAYSEWTTYGNAVLLAYMTGMITAFLLNKYFVFEKSRHTTSKEFAYFTLVNLVAVAQTYFISVGLALHLFPAIGFNYYPETVAHAIGVVFPVFTSYIGHKYLSFRRADAVV